MKHKYLLPLVLLLSVSSVHAEIPEWCDATTWPDKAKNAFERTKKRFEKTTPLSEQEESDPTLSGDAVGGSDDEHVLYAQYRAATKESGRQIAEGQNEKSEIEEVNDLDQSSAPTCQDTTKEQEQMELLEAQRAYQQHNVDKHNQYKQFALGSSVVIATATFLTRQIQIKNHRQLGWSTTLGTGFTGVGLGVSLYEWKEERRERANQKTTQEKINELKKENPNLRW